MRPIPDHAPCGANFHRLADGLKRFVIAILTLEPKGAREKGHLGTLTNRLHLLEQSLGRRKVPQLRQSRGLQPKPTNAFFGVFIAGRLRRSFGKFQRIEGTVLFGNQPTIGVANHERLGGFAVSLQRVPAAQPRSTEFGHDPSDLGT